MCRRTRGLSLSPTTSPTLTRSLSLSRSSPAAASWRRKSCSFVSLIIRGLGAFPVSRGKGDTAAVEKAVGYVKEGKVVAIFPEGHRSPDGKLQKLKSGAVVIAAETGGGMQPCVVRKGPKKGLRTPVVIRYGKFISHEELGLTGRTPSQIRSANKLLTKTLTDLLEETDV